MVTVSEDELIITPTIHGSIMFKFRDLVIHVDPISRTDYSKYPQADLILITHHHGDHLEPNLINRLTKSNTKIIGTELCGTQLTDYIVMKNGDRREIEGFYQIKYNPVKNVQCDYYPSFMKSIKKTKRIKGIQYAIADDGEKYPISPDISIEKLKIIRRD